MNLAGQRIHLYTLNLPDENFIQRGQYLVEGMYKNAILQQVLQQFIGPAFLVYLNGDAVIGLLDDVGLVVLTTTLLAAVSLATAAARAGPG